MDTKLLGLILQGDKKNEREFNRIKETYEEMSNSKAHVITSFANGESTVLSDSSDSKLDNLRVCGKSEQFTTSGAQLVDASKIVTTSTVGLTTIVNSDGSLTINGTPSQAYAPAVYFTNMLLEPGTYYISGGQNAVGCVYAQMNITLSDGTFKHYINKAFEIDGTEQKVILYIQTGADLNTINNYTIYPMLNKGSTALPYEPYTGGIPSPNPQYPQEIVSAGDDGELEVGVYGKNLHPNEIGDCDRVNETGVMANHGFGNHASSLTNFPIPVGETLTFSHNHTFSNGNRVVKLMQYDENNKFIGRHEKSGKHNIITFTPDEKCRYMSFVIYDDQGVSLDGLRMQLEVGDSATSYEPYKPAQPLTIQTPNGLPGIKVTDASLATYTDADGQMWCADEIDFGRGVYVKRVGEKIINNVEDTLVQDAVKYVIRVKKIPDMKVGNWQNGLSSMFICGTRKQDGVIRFGANDNYLYFYTNNDIFETREKADTFFAENPMTVQYILATPIETPLSESELTVYRALHTNYPTTTILNDSGAHMKVKYTADKKNYIDNKFAQITNAVLSMGSNI